MRIKKSCQLLFAVLLVTALNLITPELVSAQSANTTPQFAIGKTFNPGYYAFLASHQNISLDILINPDIEGVKVKYKWKDLEPELGVYDFSRIEEHLERLAMYNKQLWIQIEYVTWTSTAEPRTPRYMWSDPSYGGDPRYYGNYERLVQNGGWYPLFWHPKVRDRLVALVVALGNRFNEEPFVEGMSIPETAAAQTEGFDCDGYQATLKEMTRVAVETFKNKHVFQMINFACFDLVAHVQWLSSVNAGVGTPDVYTFKQSLTGTIYPLFLQHGDNMPVGPDVQWANYTRNQIPVADILDFAIERTNPWYIFWGLREPYFVDEVLPAIFKRKLPRAEAFYSSDLGLRVPNPPILLTSP